ncbi:hypothetical protein [Streptomyces sp. NPDC005181]|uniref:TetR/AcrR family transcriptional regulator n=1 Tax=Streptomyces sp. NPDC005181 TaxID=3156869 RepID=UPI0033ADC51A
MRPRPECAAQSPASLVRSRPCRAPSAELLTERATETERTPAFTSLLSAQTAGLVMLRYVLGVEPLASLDFDELMEWLVPAIEVHFDRLPQE